jgi:MFS superfamily sulfate permease-like transporter
MKINRDILLKPSFFVGLIIAFIAAFFKISHWAGVYPLIIVGLAASLIFMITAIYEVSVSTRIKKSEKIMWIVCLVLICNLTGFFYIYSGRKRII